MGLPEPDEDEQVTELDVLKTILTSAVHASPRWTLQMGTQEQFVASDSTMSHDMRAFNRNGLMVYECITCLAAERERQGDSLPNT